MSSTENKVTQEAPDKGEKIADSLVHLTLESGADLYLDQFHEPHIALPGKPAVGFPIKGSVFKHWLRGKYWEVAQTGFSSETFNTAAGSLAGKAFHEGVVRNLYNRAARVGSVIYYDLGDDTRVVEISPVGWQVISDPPVLFRRFKHQSPQVEPVRGGKLSRVLNYVNLSQDDRILFLTYLVVAVVPDIPRVVIVNIGDQGSAKSTALRVARALIDPSLSGLISPPNDPIELAQASNHHYCLYLDNMSKLSDDLSDGICRLSTGIGFTKRMLYTDDEDILFNQMPAVGITGINLVAQKADLLDRCLILNYERIPDGKRIDERDFWEGFNKDKPYILGGLFDILSVSLRTAPSLSLETKPRMADYVRHAAAAAVALGKTSEDFLLAFGRNVERQNKAAVESSPTAQVIITFMDGRQEWKGSSSELYDRLSQLAESLKLHFGGADGFPKSSTWLWKRIMSVRPNLGALGITATKEETSFGSVIKLVCDKNAATVTTVNSDPEGGMVAMAVNSSSTAIQVPSQEYSEKENLESIALEMFGSGIE